MKASSESIPPSDLHTLRYPVYVTDKEDGIRMHTAMSEGGICGFSRKNILIPNMWVQNWCEDAIPFLDGELVIPGCDFSDNQSFFMSEVTLSKPWKYMVFDHTGYKLKTYLQRLRVLKTQMLRYLPLDSNVWFLEPSLCENASQVLQEFESAMARGKEGIIIRSDSPYKEGRATYKEQTMLKMKAWEDAEGTILEVLPQYENNNEKQKDNLGYTKRSSHRENKEARQCCGAFIVRHADGRIFKVGAFGNDSDKAQHWRDRDKLRNRILTFKFQPHGTKHKPRTPIAKGFRQD